MTWLLAAAITWHERFHSRVEHIPFHSCWEWTGGIRGEYGQFHMGKRNVSAHRASWMLHNGEIPEGLFVLHHCDNKLCVRPEHLFLGTQQDNIDDMERKGRANKTGVMALHKKRRLQTHCKHGHPLSGDNLYVWRNHRCCRACRNEASRRSRC